MTEPYRTAAEIAEGMPELPERLKPKQGGALVRRNGSRCMCRPPGWLWCWWYDVEPGERWECVHGGVWMRWKDFFTSPEWSPMFKMTSGWELRSDHPMCNVFRLMGWHHKPIAGDTAGNRERWFPEKDAP